MSSSPYPPFIDVLDFWWNAGSSKWFAKDAKFDKAIADQFSELHAAGAAGGLSSWADEPASALALILLLDQFSRNLYRDDPRAFSCDAMALDIAERAISRGFEKAFQRDGKVFFAMPYMHSEALDVQERGVDYYHRNKLKEEHYYALIHLDVVRRFGRFPHRNACLGRSTTPAEQAFLDAGNFSG